MRLLAPLTALCSLVLIAGCSHLPSFMGGHDEVKQYGVDLGGVGGAAPDEDKVRDFEKKLAGNEWKGVRAKRTGWQLHRQGKIKEAMEYYKEALGYDHKDVEALTYLGRAYRDMGMLYQSARTLIRAVKTSPKNAEAHAQLGVTFDMQGNYSQAEQEHRRAVQLNPRSSEYHNNLGFCYFLQGRTGEAIAELQAAIRANPDDRRAHNNLAYIYAAQGRFDSAFAELRQSGTEAEAYNNLGYLYFLKGKRQKAIESFEQALNLNYSLAAAQQNLKAITMQGETAPPAIGFDQSGPSPVLVEEDMDGPVPKDGLNVKPGGKHRDVSGTLLDGSLSDIPAAGGGADTEDATGAP